ncbi:SAV_2336 N-terminal domain-related protein [Streptomyces sp. NPDC002054]|uniref:SAV_2336 N-terminal domain-related protein n=1 Tax=Streptomyces sp. NPDC002054 TaxID=3154663 RepID=UPI003334614A
MAVPDPVPDLRTLVGALRAGGLDLTAEELADALWLATRTAAVAAAGRDGVAAGPEPEPAQRRSPVDPATAYGLPEGAGDRPPGTAQPEQPVRPADEEPVTLYAARPPEGPGLPAGPDGAELPPGLTAVPVRVPAAAALPRILDIQRALRALQRHRPPAPPARLVLDEPATADASARAFGQIIPVLRPEARRETTVRLVMDASPSMAVWQDMFEELRAVCERLGAFRDVQAHYLHRLPDGTPAVGRGPCPDTGVRSGDQLRDPTGRGITMVVSDCTGPMWREGRAQRLLHRWTECTPSVVVQPLPQRLWGRTWLPTERGTLARLEGPAGGLGFRPDRPPVPGRPVGGLTVPVLPPSARALGAWARLVAGLGSGPVPAEVGRVLPGHPGSPVPPPRAARPPRELVRRFRSTASPRAVQLAVYLSATPLTLPVMRLVQRTMLPDSEPSDLAEVLLAGLLRRSPDSLDSADQWYEFVPGVQEVLLGPLGRDEAALVLKHCSEYVLQHFGRGVRNFPALAVSQLTGVPVAEPEPDAEAGARPPAPLLPHAFAQVSAKVVRRYLPVPSGPPGSPEAPAPVSPLGRGPALRAARARLAAHDRDGGQRALHEAVAVLRRAAAVPAGPRDTPGEAETELAGALLRLWGVQRDPELLTEAEETIRRVGGAAARAVLGRVLFERAGAAGPAEAAELLTAADREFAAVTAEPLLDRELLVDSAIRRAEALVRLCELRGDAGPLHEALAALEAVDGSGVGFRLALGRVLLALAEQEADAEAGRGWAERAADQLEAALRALEGGQEDFPHPAPSRNRGEPPGPPGPADAAGAQRGGPGSAEADAGSARPAPGSAGSRGSGPATDPGPSESGRADGSDGSRGSGVVGEPGVPGAGVQGVDVGRVRARVRVEFGAALRFLPGRLEEAGVQLAVALEEAAGEPELRLAGLVCLARLERARYARDGDPAALEAAAEAYGRARRLIPRDGDTYAEVLPEWGEVLLARARAAGGRAFASTAVRVLRDSRAAVPQSDARAGRRLRRLAAGLRLRHTYEGDLVDLREAEYLLELAGRISPAPLDRAKAWRDHGDVQQDIHGHTRAADRLDRAADSYRRAWRAALDADQAGDVAAQLAARVQELRGEVLERLDRPRAALDAYRAALELWQRIGEPGAEEQRAAVLDRIRALEAP